MDVSVATGDTLREEIGKSDAFRVADKRVARLWPLPPKSDGKPRVDPRRVPE